MGAIFLSYAREDQAFAECVARVLEAAGHSVWWDRHIDGGAEFSAQIEVELDKAGAVVVAWSNRSKKSRWVRDEAAVAVDGGKLVPVSVDGSGPPMGFRQFHTMDLSGWKGGKRDERTEQLLQAINGRLSSKDHGPTPYVARELPAGLHRPQRTTEWAIAATLVLMIAAAALFLTTDRGASRVAALKPTIALTPFSASSSDRELNELALQAHNSIAHTFSQSGVPLRLVNSAPAGPPTGIDFLISGDVSRSADKVVATVRLVEAAQGATVFSVRFDAGPQDARDLPERIGAQMAGNLTWSAPLMMLDRREPLEPALLADLLESTDFNGDQLQAYQNSKRVVDKRPDVAIAQIAFAFNSSFVFNQLPRLERAEAVTAARIAADRGISLAPTFGDTYGVWCGLYSETMMAKCEDRLRAGKRVDPDAPFLNSFLSGLLRKVGRIDEAVELARLSHSHDPYVPTKIAWMLRVMDGRGDSDASRELYRRGVRWWPEFRSYFLHQRLSGMIESADWTAIHLLEQEAGPTGLPRDESGVGAVARAMQVKSLSAARKACSGNGSTLADAACMLALSALGDQDRSFAISDKLYPRRVGSTPAETELIWFDQPSSTVSLAFLTSPAAAALRRDRRYLQLAQRVGLLGYWRSGRLPDFCRNQPEPVCQQLAK